MVERNSGCDFYYTLSREKLNNELPVVYSRIAKSSTLDLVSPLRFRSLYCLDTRLKPQARGALSRSVQYTDPDEMGGFTSACHESPIGQIHVDTRDKVFAHPEA